MSLLCLLGLHRWGPWRYLHGSPTDYAVRRTCSRCLAVSVLGMDR